MKKEERIAREVIMNLRSKGLSYGEMQRAIRLSKDYLDDLRKIKK